MADKKKVTTYLQFIESLHRQGIISPRDILLKLFKYYCNIPQDESSQWQSLRSAFFSYVAEQPMTGYIRVCILELHQVNDLQLRDWLTKFDIDEVFVAQKPSKDSDFFALMTAFFYHYPRYFTPKNSKLPIANKNPDGVVTLDKSFLKHTWMTARYFQTCDLSREVESLGRQVFDVLLPRKEFDSFGFGETAYLIYSYLLIWDLNSSEQLSEIRPRIIKWLFSCFHIPQGPILAERWKLFEKLVPTLSPEEMTFAINGCLNLQFDSYSREHTLLQIQSLFHLLLHLSMETRASYYDLFVETVTKRLKGGLVLELDSWVRKFAPSDLIPRVQESMQTCVLHEIEVLSGERDGVYRLGRFIRIGELASILLPINLEKVMSYFTKRMDETDFLRTLDAAVALTPLARQITQHHRLKALEILMRGIIYFCDNDLLNSANLNIVFDGLILLAPYLDLKDRAQILAVILQVLVLIQKVLVNVREQALEADVKMDLYYCFQRIEQCLEALLGVTPHLDPSHRLIVLNAVLPINKITESHGVLYKTLVELLAFMDEESRSKILENLELLEKTMFTEKIFSTLSGVQSFAKSYQTHYHYVSSERQRALSTQMLRCPASASLITTMSNRALPFPRELQYQFLVRWIKTIGSRSIFSDSTRQGEFAAILSELSSAMSQGIRVYPELLAPICTELHDTMSQWGASLFDKAVCLSRMNMFHKQRERAEILEEIFSGHHLPQDLKNLLSK